MRRIRLVHWKSAEAAERIETLRSAGYEVEHDDRAGPATLRSIRDDHPAAVVIDMTRIPSQGRDFGLALRQHGGTRRVPLVFVGGDPAKIDRVKELLPDAVYTPWSRIRSAPGRAFGSDAEGRARCGLKSGLVHYKVCSIDDTWSGLRFARRKSE